ncbi:BadF/BadG/BcrA/BcrD ATPase family protein [Sulfitobacter sp. PR48]|jgi:glucosamine kinase|nr:MULTISPECIES: BadF/BadG/BcrA/BcrD ATPase family protein [unclassified Sulfitobacter]MCZ4255162.1 ATPase [Sulfitobacter sp. G21635-S1]MDD9720596.1 BadF/BadG/BcrA/BcrD ATPase family protein [Sulfitobacter sp. PR48]
MTNMHEPILIAVDAGGTGCRAAAGTAARGILADARGGPANVENNFGGAIANITAAVRAALAQAGLADTPLERIIGHVGAAGANSPETMAEVAAALPYGHTMVSGDKETTVAGALGAHDGYVLGIGTGTFISRQCGGVVSTVSGWGFQISDQASGAWLGHRLLERTLLAHDGIEPQSALTRRTLDRMGGLHEMRRFCLTATPTDYATLAPEVLSGAQEQDPAAMQIIARAVDFLEKGLAALDFTPGDRLCLTGGVGPHYRGYLSEDVVRNLVAPQGNAMQGAFALARQAAQQEA